MSALPLFCGKSDDEVRTPAVDGSPGCPGGGVPLNPPVQQMNEFSCSSKRTASVRMSFEFRTYESQVAFGPPDDSRQMYRRVLASLNQDWR